MEDITQPVEPGDDEKAAIHRRLVSDGGLAGGVMSEIAVEALERADLDLFIQVTQDMQQSDDPEAVRRAGLLLNTYANMAEGVVPEEQ